MQGISPNAQSAKQVRKQANALNALGNAGQLPPNLEKLQAIKNRDPLTTPKLT